MSSSRRIEPAPFPAWLTSELYTSSFGVRGVAWSTIAGVVLLYEAGYSGPLTTWGPAPSRALDLTGASLVDGEAGYSTPTLGSNPVPIAASVPGVLGTFVDGPAASLPTGSYTVALTVNVSAIPGANAPVPTELSLWIGASSFAQPPFYGWSMPYSAFSSRGWTTVTFNITLPGPTIQFSVQGVALATNVQAFLETVEVTPA